MSKKNIKKRTKKEDIINDKNTELTPKEIYDIKKEQKRKNNIKKDNKKKNKKTKTYSIGTRIFAIIMLILMIGSCLASVLAYMNR